MKKVLFAILSLLLATACSKQNEEAKPSPPSDPIKHVNRKGTIISDKEGSDWFVKDPERNKVEGASSNRSIQDLDLKSPNKIIVAVIDSGVDTDHEDLKEKMWRNPGESGQDADGNDKASNGIDDDGNGYIDDIHGWNFIGGADGKNVGGETLEITREVIRYEALLSSGATIPPEKLKYYEEVKTAFEKELSEAKKQLEVFGPKKEQAEAASTILKEKIGLEDLSKEKLEAVQSGDEDVKKAVADLLALVKDFRSIDRLFRIYEYFHKSVNVFFNKEHEKKRKEIVGDDPSDFEDISYGNNDV